MIHDSRLVLLRVQLGPGPECRDDFQRPELLLPLWEPSRNHGNRRKINIQFVRRSFVLCCARGVDIGIRSLQFDPAPRAGEPLVSRRVPDYFLVI